jgi:uncharacterized membrane protein
MEENTNDQEGAMPSWIVWTAVSAFGVFIFGLFLSAGVPHELPALQEIAYRAATLMLAALNLTAIYMLAKQVAGHKRQVRHQHTWNTLISYHQLFPAVPPEDANHAMRQLATELKFVSAFKGFGTPIDDATVDILYSDAEKDVTTRDYLDGFELFCGAIAAGIVDEDYAFSMQSGRVIRTLTIFRGFIKRCQAANAMAYLELEKRANAWDSERQKKDHNYRVNSGVGSSGKGKVVPPIM